MAEVPDRLVPSDGLTNATLTFAGLDLTGSNNVNLRFDIHDEQGRPVGVFTVATPKAANADLGIASGHRRMADILRQWLYTIDKMAEHYKKQGGRLDRQATDNEPTAPNNLTKQ